MLEQCKEIVHKFNSVYGETLVEPQILLPDNTVCMPRHRRHGQDEQVAGQLLFLSDTEAEVKKKVGHVHDPATCAWRIRARSRQPGIV